MKTINIEIFQREIINSIIIIKGDNYYITDGYSEFIIKNNNNDLYDKDVLDDIYTGMISVALEYAKIKVK